MRQTVEAIYENGVLRPLQPLEGIAQHSKVKVTVGIEQELSHPLEDCIGIMPEEDAEEMKRIIDDEFEKINVSEWQ